jgi:hypothetical protein
MKPRFPITIPLLAIVTGAGLISLFLAAHYAFGQVTVSPVHAIAAALLIETAMAFEAITFTRTGNRLALVGLIVSFAVSMLYNYVQASLRATELHTSWIIHEAVLFALAVGPLSALAFVALALGNEMKKYAERVEAWEALRLVLKEEAEDWSRSVEQQKLDAELALQAEEAEAKRQLERERFLADERARKRAERREEKGRKPTENIPEGLPAWLVVLPENRKHWNELVEGGVIKLPDERPTGKQMSDWIPAVGTDKSGRNWIGDVWNGQLSSKP